MLITATNLRELSFGELMEVYTEDNRKNAKKCWPDEPEYRALALAEQGFYDYLHQVFFRTAQAQYLIWEEQGHYVSALRLEPYRDGLLLEALATAPAYRNRGYATMLVKAALEQVGETRVYSHVGKHNTPSLGVHKKCGFSVISGHAAYADGSVDNRSFTLCSTGAVKL